MATGGPATSRKTKGHVTVVVGAMPPAPVIGALTQAVATQHAMMNAAEAGRMKIVLQQKLHEVLSVPPATHVAPDIKAAAEMLSKYGRNGDTLLAHITPREAAFLKMLGGAGTRNPMTGLLQFFDGGDGGNGSTGGMSGGDMGNSGGDNGQTGGFNSQAGLDMNGQTIGPSGALAPGQSGSYDGSINGPNGFLGSNTALGLGSSLASMLGGPIAGALVGGAGAIAQGRGVAGDIGAVIGGATGIGAGMGASLAQGMADHGVTGDTGLNGPATMDNSPASQNAYLSTLGALDPNGTGAAAQPAATATTASGASPELIQAMYGQAGLTAAGYT